jgi:hypothetical protein
VSDPIPPNEAKLPERVSALIMRSDGRYSRIYRDGMKFRRESYDSIDSRRVIILREDLEIAYRIVESEKIYFTIRMSSEFVRVQRGQQDFDSWSKWIWLRHEEIDGEPCEVFEMEKPKQKDRSGGSPGPREIIHMSHNTNWRRRLTTFDNFGNIGIIIDWLEISLAPISPELFEVPPYFVELSLASGKPLRIR